MKSIILLTILAASVNASALSGSRTNICKVWYDHDMFSRFLTLSIGPEAAKNYLWMDTPTPYGIRPYAYEITSLSCNTDKSVHLEGNMNNGWEKVVFNSKNSNTTGKLEYFNDKNVPMRTINFECEAPVLESVCP